MGNRNERQSINIQIIVLFAQNAQHTNIVHSFIKLYFNRPTLQIMKIHRTRGGFEIDGKVADQDLVRKELETHKIIACIPFDADETLNLFKNDGTLFDVFVKELQIHQDWKF